MSDRVEVPELPLGLCRTKLPHPQHAEALPGSALVFLGRRGDEVFAVRPYRNHHNRWYWRDPVWTLSAQDLAPGGWAESLKRLPAEGFYQLPKTLIWEEGGRWLENAIVQLGYNPSGQGIIFVAERRDDATQNALHFSERGKLVDDDLLAALKWAPILPVPGSAEGGTPDGSGSTLLH